MGRPLPVPLFHMTDFRMKGFPKSRYEWTPARGEIGGESRGKVISCEADDASAPGNSDKRPEGRRP